ncbi:hypothetical protein EJB05_05922, partial [Eragrostis curvula]
MKQAKPRFGRSALRCLFAHRFARDLRTAGCRSTAFGEFFAEAACEAGAQARRSYSPNISPQLSERSSEGFTLWSAQDWVTSFLGEFSQKEWIERRRRGIDRRINRVYQGLDIFQSERPYPEDLDSEDEGAYELIASGPPYFSASACSTVEMDPSTHVETPEVSSSPRNAEIPSLERESSPAIALNPVPSAEDPAACPDAHALMPLTDLYSFSLAEFGLSVYINTGEVVDSENTCGTTFAGSLPSCSGVKSGFSLPKKASFSDVLGKRKFDELVVSDAIPSEGVASAIPSGDLQPSSQPLALVDQFHGHMNIDLREVDPQAILSSLSEDLRDVELLSSFAKKLQLPKVELGLSNLSSEALFRSLISHQVMSLTLTQACARLHLPSEDEISRISSLESSLAKADEALKASSSAVSKLEREISLSFIGLLKELLRTVGANYDILPEGASPEDAAEWLRVNVKGHVKACRDYSFDAVVLMIRDLMHSFLCGGSDAIEVVARPSFTMKASDPGFSYGEVEAKCFRLIDEFWWKKELMRGGFKRGDALPQDLVDHFEELDRLTGRNALIEVPPQPVPLAVFLLT